MNDLEWKLIPGYPGYEVSNHGDVRRTTAFRRYPAGMVLKPKIGSNGYPQVTLYRDGRCGYFCVHRLVALAFLGEPPGKRYQVAHNDGSRQNNHVSNLRWASAHDNALDRRRHCTVPDRKGERHPLAKLSDELVMELRKKRRHGFTYPEIAKQYRIPKLTLYDAIVGNTWRHLPGAAGCRRLRNDSAGVEK